jgi:23S rRNA pseudouridine2604 synthase
MELMRLSKRMADLGLCSRREADQWIERGWVFVDGQRIDVLGTKVTEDQQISLDAKARSAQQERVTILINKPIGFVSGQAEDGHEPASKLVTQDSRWRADQAAQVLGSAKDRAGAGRAARYRFDRLAGADPRWPHCKIADRR